MEEHTLIRGIIRVLGDGALRLEILWIAEQTIPEPKLVWLAYSTILDGRSASFQVDGYEHMLVQTWVLAREGLV